jgi:ABC-type sugar transport system ATPase subunit
VPEIKLTNVTKRWGKFYAVDNLNLDIEDNAFITLLGPSGCGKTTTLRMIAGLETPTSGQIKIGDRVVYDSDAGINIPPNKRKVGFLFQNYALWPNMTVYQNIAFGLNNIKEEMAVKDLDAQKISAQVAALKNPKEYFKLIDECKDKTGKVEAGKAYLKLIDAYTLSMYGAKELYGFGLKDAAACEEKRKQLESQLAIISKSHAAKNESLNENFEVLKDGKPVREVRKLSKEEIDLSVRRVSRIVKIGMFMDRYPAELSGGQQQRVAIARTLAPEPQVLFMDEPLSNLDAKLRVETREEIRRIQQEVGITTIFVTHDQEEAMSISDQIAVMKTGVVQQFDVPQNMYLNPCNRFVATFLGTPEINIINVEVSGGVIKCGDVVLRTGVDVKNGTYKAGIRPESFTHRGDDHKYSVNSVRMIGRDLLLHLDMAGGDVRAITHSGQSISAGDTVEFSIRESSIILFGSDDKVIGKF